MSIELCTGLYTTNSGFYSKKEKIHRCLMSLDIRELTICLSVTQFPAEILVRFSYITLFIDKFSLHVNTRNFTQSITHQVILINLLLFASRSRSSAPRHSVALIITLLRSPKAGSLRSSRWNER